MSRVRTSCLSLLVTVACDCRGKAVLQTTEALRVGVSAAPKTLDPRYATDATGSRIAHDLVFSSLVSMGFELKMEPNVASHWETPDDTTYIFHLREGVTFHDGSPLTAADVKFTYEHLMAPETKSPFAAIYQGLIAKIEVLNPRAIKFTLKHPTASFLTNMNASILPREIVGSDEARFKESLIGSGPFRFVKQSPGSVLLSANPTYFGGRPPAEQIHIEVVQDDNTRFLKLKKGELDLVINGLPRSKISDFSTDADLRQRYDVIETPGLAFKYLAVNLRDSHLAKRSVRQAIAHGINVDEIIEYRLEGHGRAANSMLAEINWFSTKDLPTYAHDPERARSLLDEAGYPDPDGAAGPKPRLTLELKTSNNQEVVGIARVLQAQLREVGIELSIRSYEWGTFYGDVKQGNFQLASMRWVGVTEPDFYYDVFHSSMAPPRGRNRGFYENARIDRLVEQGRAELSPERRKTIYDEVQRIAATELPYINLWHETNVSIVAKRVQGYRSHPQGGFDGFQKIRLSN